MTDDQTLRQRLAQIIARQDAARGRPLTAREQLDNLAAALAEDADTPCPFCGVQDDDVCGWLSDGQACRLEPAVRELMAEIEGPETIAREPHGKDET